MGFDGFFWLRAGSVRLCRSVVLFFWGSGEEYTATAMPMVPLCCARGVRMGHGRGFGHLEEKIGGFHPNLPFLQVTWHLWGGTLKIKFLLKGPSVSCQ